MGNYYDKGTRHGQFEEPKKAFTHRKEKYLLFQFLLCQVLSSILVKFSWHQDQFDVTFIVTWEAYSEIMSSFCALQNFGQEKQITISKKARKCIDS